MFCPKCGTQNADEAKFCRGCGADVGNVLATVEGRPPDLFATAKKQIELFSSGLRGLIIGLCMFLGIAVGLVISLRLAVVAIFVLPFASYFVGTGISRLFHARALKKLRNGDPIERTALTSGEQPYLQPDGSIYQTDDLLAAPRSVTENTTRHLEIPKEK